MKSLVFFALAVWSASAWAQCDVNVAVSDGSCTNGHDCFSTSGCESTSFTVDCSGCYCLKISIDCGAESCENCRACANVYQGAVRISKSNCHNPDCESGEVCDINCCEGGLQNHFRLTNNVQYKLFVCKNSCPPANCGDCDNECIATAELVFVAQTSSCD